MKTVKIKDIMYYNDASHEVVLRESINSGLYNAIEDNEYRDGIIVISSEKNYLTGQHMILDGNHRFSVMTEFSRLDEVSIYMISEDLLNSLGFLDDDGDDDAFINFVITNGEKIGIKK